MCLVFVAWFRYQYKPLIQSMGKPRRMVTIPMHYRTRTLQEWTDCLHVSLHAGLWRRLCRGNYNSGSQCQRLAHSVRTYFKIPVSKSCTVKKSITNHDDLLTWKLCIALDIMKFYVWKQHLSHAVKQGMKSNLGHDLKCKVCKEHLNHVSGG